MQLYETRAFKFSPPVTEHCEIQCPECGEWATLAGWDIGSEDCETCGDHDTMDCTACGYQVSYIHQYVPLSTR